MSIVLWCIVVMIVCYVVDDMLGNGVKDIGGCWNLVGFVVIYCLVSIVLVVYEMIVYLCSGGLLLNCYLVCIDVFDVVWNFCRIFVFFVGWDVLFVGMVSV